MASPHVREFKDETFEAEVLKSPTPVLVDFWAEWCMPCRLLTPTIDALAEEFSGRVMVGKMDTDANRQTPVNYKIAAIPTVIVFKGGQVYKKFVGLTSKDELANTLKTVLAG